MIDRGVGRAIVALLAFLVPPPLSAQTPPMVVGVVGGYTETEHAWRPTAEATSVAGVIIGGFLDVQTPLSWLTAGAELAYSQRGSDVMLDVDGLPTPGGIRTDYLTFAVRVRAALALGPVRAHVAAGPITDFAVRSRLDALLIQVLDEEKVAPFGVMAGAGLGAWVTERAFVEVEVRLVEGLQSSYEGDLISARNRSRELVARVGWFVGG